MNNKGLIAAAGLALALAACGDRPEDGTELSASIALQSAQLDHLDGQTVDVEALAAMPGMDGVLLAWAESARAAAAANLRDPTDPLWGAVWTRDYLHVCGWVNGRNAYGAYAGPVLFYSPVEDLAYVDGTPGFDTDRGAACAQGGHLTTIIPGTPGPL